MYLQKLEERVAHEMQNSEDLISFFQGVLSFMELHNFFLNGVLYPGFIDALKLLAVDKGKVCSQITCFLLSANLV